MNAAEPAACRFCDEPIHKNNEDKSMSPLIKIIIPKPKPPSLQCLGITAENETPHPYLRDDDVQDRALRLSDQRRQEDSRNRLHSDSRDGSRSRQRNPNLDSPRIRRQSRSRDSLRNRLQSSSRESSRSRIPSDNHESARSRMSYMTNSPVVDVHKPKNQQIFKSPNTTSNETDETDYKKVSSSLTDVTPSASDATPDKTAAGKTVRKNLIHTRSAAFFSESSDSRSSENPEPTVKITSVNTMPMTRNSRTPPNNRINRVPSNSQRMKEVPTFRSPPRNYREDCWLPQNASTAPSAFQEWHPQRISLHDKVNEINLKVPDQSTV